MEMAGDGAALTAAASTAEEAVEQPVLLLDDLFRKTEAQPAVYWLPPDEAQVERNREMRLRQEEDRRQRALRRSPSFSPPRRWGGPPRNDAPPGRWPPRRYSRSRSPLPPRRRYSRSPSPPPRARVGRDGRSGSRSPPPRSRSGSPPRSRGVRSRSPSPAPARRSASPAPMAAPPAGTQPQYPL